MGASDVLPDYYSVLQVHPDADDEVIAAAYRQLMKKYHPDVAGEDPARIAEYLARSTALNAAFSVLRDPTQRKHYDSARIFFGTPRPASPAPGPRPPGAPPTSPPDDASGSRQAPRTGPSSAEPAGVVYVPPSPSHALLPAPLSWLVAAYYLLPGPYEWEDGGLKDLLPLVLMPLVGISAYALWTGRLAPWLGASLFTTLIASAVLLLLSVPLLMSLPRVAAAAGPSVVLLSGVATPTVQQAHIPFWLAWLLASFVSLILSARLFVFAVLPTLAVCWLLSR